MIKKKYIYIVELCAAGLGPVICHYYASKLKAEKHHDAYNKLSVNMYARIMKVELK